MKPVLQPISGNLLRLACGLLLIAASVIAARADQIEMKNGDLYHGDVLSLTTNAIVFKSPFFGTVHLPRQEISGLIIGSRVEMTGKGSMFSTARSTASPAMTNASSDISAALRGLGSQSNLIQQVENQFLAGAGPEAKSKFDSLLGGLASGQISMKDLRAEAKGAADQIRSLKSGLGGDAGGELDGYLAILENFLKETESDNQPAAPQGGSAATNTTHVTSKAQ